MADHRNVTQHASEVSPLLQAERYHRKLKCGCITVFCVTMVIFFVKTILLTARYSMQMITCKLNVTTTIDNYTHTYFSDNLDMGYIFTVIIYAFVNVLRIVEYAVLGAAGLKFVADKEVVKMYMRTYKENKSKVIRFTLIWFLVLFLYLLLGIAVPTFGILQELEYDDKMAPCYNHIGIVYIAYSAVNYLRYFCAFSVRMALIVTTAIVREIWREKEQTLVSTKPNTNTCINIAVVENGTSDHKWFFEDWKKTAIYLQHWTNGYKETGDKVREIVKIFQTWFIIPWVIFFIESSLDVSYTLQPWNKGSTMSKMYYLLYNIIQLITLLVPFLFATFINLYHRNFYKRMKKDLLYGCNSASQQAFAHVQFNIEKEEEFDFIPRIPCTDVEIRVDGPLYVFLLLLGVFFTVCKPLLS